MHYYESAYYGMNFIWWIFWGFLLVGMFSLWTPVPRRRLKELKETPQDILKRRLAKGEINEKEFINLSAHLDSEKGKPFPQSPMRAV